jgi:hypothetical protein
MNILSIDVGIKHLAYCILCVNKDKTYTISNWDVLDLCNTKTYICSCTQKNKKKCTNNAKFKKNGILYCKKHAKNSGFKIPTIELSEKKIKKCTIPKLKTLIQKYNIPFSFIKPHKDTFKTQMINTIIEEVNIKYLENINKTNCNAASFHMVELGINLKKKFNDCLDYTKIHKLAIENQIGPIALRMKCLQGMIMQHFIENGITDISEVSSSNKLKEYLNGKKTKYNERKKISIQVTRDLITKNKELNIWLDEFNKSKKKDDLADCYLQGLWYIKNKI